MIPLGVNLVSPEGPAAAEQFRRLALMRPTLGKVQIPPGFAWQAQHVDEMLAACPTITMVVLRGEDCQPDYATTKSHLIGRGFVDVVRRHPAVTFWVEVGNEPNICGMAIATYKLQALDTVRRLKPELADVANLRWTISLPTKLTLVQTIFAGGEYEQLCGGIASHLYAHYDLLETGAGENDWTDIWYWLLANTSRPILLTEVGINDTALTSQAQKAERYLSFVERAGPRLHSVALWAVVSDDPRPFIANFHLDEPVLRQLAAREGGTPMALSIATPLISQGTFTASQAQTAVKSQSPRTPYTDFHVDEIVTRTMHWCSVFGFNHDLVLSQMVHETNWFRFTGDVGPWQWNFAGLGATGGIPGHSFDSIEAGVLAVVAHHAVYRWGPKQNWPTQLQQYAGEHVDPRYDEVLESGNAGKMIVLGDYRGTWAVPGTTYPESLVTRSRQIAAFSGEEPPPVAGPYEHVIRGLIDRRGDLKINTGSPSPYGPRQKVGLAEKRGVVVHYGGPPPSNPGTFAVAQSYASYHVGKDWSTSGAPIYGDGLMYHVAIGSKGEKWLCRDLEAVLWHCGVTEWNKRSLAIQFLIGDGQHATAAQLKAASEVADDWRAYTSTPRGEVWGHQELSATSCPGTLMADFVRPYRAGEDEEDDMPPPAPERIKLEGNPFGDFEFVAGFAGFVWQLGWVRAPADPYAGILSVVGYPKENERGTEAGAEQKCEKATLTWNRGAEMPWDVQLAQIKDVPSGDGIPPEQVQARMTEIAEHAGKIEDLAAAPF